MYKKVKPSESKTRMSSKDKKSSEIREQKEGPCMRIKDYGTTWLVMDQRSKTGQDGITLQQILDMTRRQNPKTKSRT
jgi:hypothetical protein